MLEKETFARGLQLINAILSKNAQIEVKSTIESYYILLSDLPNQFFIQGVTNLMKNWNNPHFKPGPGEIRKYVEDIMYGGLSREEFILIAKSYKSTGKDYSNPMINSLLKQINQDKLSSNEIVFLENNTQKFIS